MAYLTVVENLRPAMVNWPLETGMICERVVRFAIFNRRLSAFRLPVA
jgi:hypothetical protein